MMTDMELKAYIAPAPDGTGLAYYLKSDADKVIAEKDAEIAKLQAMLEERNKQVGELKDRIAPKQSDKTLQERLNKVCEKHGVSTLQDLDWAFCESEKRHTKDNIEAAKEIEHHKYRRCLAMAKWCSERVARIEKDYAFWRHGKDYASNFYKRWKKLWLELAEKFKEVK